MSHSADRRKQMVDERFRHIDPQGAYVNASGKTGDLRFVLPAFLHHRARNFVLATVCDCRCCVRVESGLSGDHSIILRPEEHFVNKIFGFTARPPEVKSVRIRVKRDSLWFT